MTGTSTRTDVGAWFLRLFSGQPHQVIGDGPNPYMLRWYVIPKNPRINVYVHKFLRSDEDRALHDHPWWFVSLVLWRGYFEVTGSTWDSYLLRVPGSLAFRRAEHRHRVALRARAGRELPAWTLIITVPEVTPVGLLVPRRAVRPLAAVGRRRMW